MPSRFPIYAVVVFIMLFSTSCCQHDTRTTLPFEGFNSCLLLTAEKIEIPPVLWSPNKMIITDSYLIVAQNKVDTLFSIFSLPDLKLMKSFGLKGIGPNELLIYSLTGSFKPVHSNSATFAIYNRMKQVIYYNVDDVIQDQELSPIIKEIPSELRYLKSIAYFSDTSIIAMPYTRTFSSELLVGFNFTKDSLIHILDFPNDYPNLDYNSKTNLYTHISAVKPSNDRYTLLYMYNGMFEIYSLNDSIPTRISYTNFPTLETNHGITNQSTILGDSETVLFSNEIHVSDRFIYIMVANSYSGGKEFSQPDKRISSPEIHVFSWDGVPIQCITLDQDYSLFTIDEADHYLYAANRDIENVIYRYKLPNY
jgi:hypothetical protein